MVNKIKELMEMVESISKQMGYPITKDDYYIEDLGCPHKWPTTLPEGYSAVYFYAHGNMVLKIGKANSKSKSRYTSQHYRFNAPSTLAKSLYADPDYHFINEDEVKEWMLNNLYRVNILIKNSCGKPATELVETILHYSFRPKYEGAIN